MIKGNKGEWSELYVLIKVLADGKLFQSDADFNADTDNVYDVVKAYKDETGYKLDFTRSSEITVVDNTKNKKYVTIEIEKFKAFSKLLLTEIKEGKGKSFSIPKMENFFNQCGITKVKADSTTKADIRLRIYDHRLAKESDLGFSIKSLIGSNSTLYNTGPGNNFIFNVLGTNSIDIDDFNRYTYAPVSKEPKISYRIKELIGKGFDFKFASTQSKQLALNLKMIDGDLPEILANAVYFRYLYGKSSLKDIAELLEEKDPLNFYNGVKSQQRFYEYKIKRFLTEAAMGMTSEKPWFGEYDSFGGVIFAKKDGDVLCFHIYDFNLFRNYLLNNTVFEQPSTGEDGLTPGKSRTTGKKFFFGWLYKNEELEFKLNLQVRFK